MANTFDMSMEAQRIEITGILDRSLAESVIEEIENASLENSTWVADGSRIQDADLDAVALLRDRVNAGGKWKMLIQGINRQVSRSFSLLGLKSGSGHVLIEPEIQTDSQTSLPATLSSIDVTLIHCPGCEKPLATKKAGTYGCPHCGCKFRINESGSAVKYEPLRIPGKKRPS